MFLSFFTVGPFLRRKKKNLFPFLDDDDDHKTLFGVAKAEAGDDDDGNGNLQLHHTQRSLPPSIQFSLH